MADQGDPEVADAPAPPNAFWDDADGAPRGPTSPELHLAGFDGAMDLLLDLVERERIDLSRISVLDMAEQVLAAMARYQLSVKLERRADWLIVASRLVQLRSRLLSPGTPAAAAAAQAEAGRDLARLRNLQFVRAAAAWLEARLQLGREVFAAPRRERDPRVSSYMRLMEACLAMLERENEQAGQHEASEDVYRPTIIALFRIPDALARMRRKLVGATQPMPLVSFLPRLAQEAPDRVLVARSAVSSTLLATLELARLGELVLGEDARFEQVTAMAATAPSRSSEA